MVSAADLTDIPMPVTFNRHKHHLNFLRERAGTWRQMPWPDVEKELLLIGSNLSDLYCGKLTVTGICSEFLQIANAEDMTSLEKLRNRLHPKDFMKFRLSDNSEWVLKLGLNESRFLHIHPAKYSPFTVRVRGTTLKTVVALAVLQEIENPEPPGLALVNRVRAEMLGLSPVKMLEKGKGIARILAIFSSP